MSSSDILTKIESNFYFLKSEFDFIIVSSTYYEEHFGNAIVEYASDRMTIRVVRDRGQYSVNFIFILDNDEFDEDIVYKALGFSSDSELLTKAQWKDISLSSICLRKNIKDIIKQFSDANYNAFKGRMTDEQQKRVKELSSGKK